MRRISIYLIAMTAVAVGRVGGQEIRDLGVGMKMEHISDYVCYQGGDELVYIIGTNPHGHLYRYTPHQENSLFDVGPVLLGTPAEEMRTYIWDLCIDNATGFVYGGTCSGSAAIFRYNPSDINNDIYKIQLDYNEVSYLWSCVNTPNYVYYSTYPKATLIRFDKSQEIVDPILSFRPFTYDFVRDNYPEIFPLIENDAYINEYENYQTQNGETYIRCVAEGPNGFIYGGTNHGFVFAYDPAEDTMGHLNIWQELGYPGDDFNFAYFMTGNSSYVFGGVDKSLEWGNFSFQLDFYNPDERVKILTTAGPGSSKLPSGWIGIVDNYLYGPYFKYDISSEMAEITGQGGRFATYTENGYIYWGNIYDKYLDYEFRTYNLDSDEMSIEVVNDIIEINKIPPYGGEWIKSITADNYTVYGGNYFASGVVAHDIHYDYMNESSVKWYGSFYGQTDALLTYNGLIFGGQYSGIGIAIVDPTLYSGYKSLKPRYDSGVIPNYVVPDYDHNPLIKSILEDSSGNEISLKLVRVNCFTSEEARNMVYFGTGPMGAPVADDPAWVIRYNCNTGHIIHVIELSEYQHNIISNMKEIKDIEYYHNDNTSEDYLFIVGSMDYGLAIINITDLDNVYVERESEYIYANRLIIDSDTKVLYLALYDKIRIYHSANDVIAYGFSAPEYYYETAGRGSKILDLARGNDGLIYYSYDARIDTINTNNEFGEFGIVPIQVPDEKAYCLTASINPDNNNIYIGSYYGHLFMIDNNNYPGPYRNEEVITKIGSKWHFSEDAQWLFIGPHGIFRNASDIAVGDFDGDGDDELIISYENGECYLRDDPNDLFNDILVHTGPPNVTHFAVGDFDGDYDDEVITAFDDDNCYLSEDGLDLDNNPPVSSGYEVFDFAVGDFDGNNNDEVITAFNNGYLCYLSDDATYLRSGSPVHDDASNAVMHFAVGDFDGNDNDEIITAFDIAECHLSEDGLDLDGGLLVHSGDFVANFAVGDFDGDRDDEVVTAFGAIGCFLSEDGTDLGGSLQVYDGTNITHFGVGDFDGDGDDDLLTSFLTESPEYEARATLSDSVTDLRNARQVYYSVIWEQPIQGFAIGDFGGENILCKSVYNGHVGPLVSGIPYIVACDVDIPLNQTLTINPGATIYFSEDTRITANGLVDITATQNEPVIFISNDFDFSGKIIVRDRLTMQNGGIITLKTLIDIDLDKEIRHIEDEEMLFAPPIELLPVFDTEPIGVGEKSGEVNVPSLKAKVKNNKGGQNE